MKTSPSSLLSKEPWEKLFMDITGLFPRCGQFRYLLVMIDSFSNFPPILPLKTEQGYEIAKAVEEKYIKNFGAPKQIHSDDASYFIGSEIKNLLNFYDILQTNSSPYYPQGNGKVERLMRAIKDMIN